MTDRNRLVADLAAVEARLHNGWDVVGAEANPAKRARYEEVWIQLLGQYQAIHDELYGTVGRYEIAPRPERAGGDQ